MPTICEQFPGRLRDLCEGRGRDGRLDPPPEASHRFRESYGLPPLSVSRYPRARAVECDSATISYE